MEAPAGVGYSYNTDLGFVYNDSQTALDNLYAVVDFFRKFPEYVGREFWIAGESYAGKFVPDLAVLIDLYNQMHVEKNDNGKDTANIDENNGHSGHNDNKSMDNQPMGTPINLKGILVGNGIMSYRYIGDS